MGTGTLAPLRRARLRPVLVVGVLCLALYCCFSLLGGDSSSPSPPPHTRYEKPPPELLADRFLSEAQCRAHFPGLLKEVDDVVAQGEFTVKRNARDLGPTIARIRDGKLSILSAARKVDLSADMLAHRSATLSSLAQVLAAWPPSPGEPGPPDTVVAFNHNDDPAAGTWSYARPADAAHHGAAAHCFAIPHFGFWAWAATGGMARAAGAIAGVEAAYPAWEDKLPRAVWRGTAWFNSAAGAGARLRQDLLRAAKGQGWADVEALTHAAAASSGAKPDAGEAVTPQQERQGARRGARPPASNALPIEAFCAHRYVIHTEGVTYSGRFQYHQQCASVVLTPPLAWMQHLTHLVRPVYSASLGIPRTPPVASSSTQTQKPLADYPSPRARAAWPTSFDPATEANLVFVAPDWSDLGATVAWLDAHPDVAAAIARRQRDTFAGRGYFGPAAEACYWRGLIRGWASVARTEGRFDDLEGVPWEEFSLREMHK
ncbi:hypothetical protein F4780DRAFT_793458 [Xylariomycetidae sp. FL0641]|nr:hypothetical protein F4780DRAFT_793458 [Xylariomycetidae sp. FL0641]